MSYRGRERGILTCYPNTSLAMAKELMEAKDIKQLPVVKRGVDHSREMKRRIVGLLHYDALWQFLRFFLESDTCLFYSHTTPNLGFSFQLLKCLLALYFYFSDYFFFHCKLKVLMEKFIQRDLK